MYGYKYIFIDSVCEFMSVSVHIYIYKSNVNIFSSFTIYIIKMNLLTNSHFYEIKELTELLGVIFVEPRVSSPEHVKRGVVGVILQEWSTKLTLNPLSSGGTFMVHKMPLFLSTPGLQGLNDRRDIYVPPGPRTQWRVGCIRPGQAILDNCFDGLNFNMDSYSLASIIF